MARSIAVSFVIALSLCAPAFCFSLTALEPHERAAMLATCQRLPGAEQPLCQRVVDDERVIANTKRSCLQALTLLLQGSTWATVRSLPAAMTCREGLARGGYPVAELQRRLAGTSAAMR